MPGPLSVTLIVPFLVETAMVISGAIAASSAGVESVVDQLLDRDDRPFDRIAADKLGQLRDRAELQQAAGCESRAGDAGGGHDEASTASLC